MKTLFFDIRHLYYLPQVLPVAEFARSRGAAVTFVLYAEEGISHVTQNALTSLHFEYINVSDSRQAIDYYLRSKPDWVILGNAPSSAYLSIKTVGTKLAFMQHGIGPKSCYYTTSEFDFDVRFVEGQVRKIRLEEMFPNRLFVDAGYAKLDPIFNHTEQTVTLAHLGLDPVKPTVLYAPTFYPSSLECFKPNWPDELAHCNLIIKPHFFSLSKPKYIKQQRLLQSWAMYSNVYIAPVEDYSLLPFMQISDVLLSEASSTVFEFAALDKPVVWCDFYHVRWTYRGIFSFRLNQRLDQDLSMFHELCERAQSPKDVKRKIEHCLANKQEKSKARTTITLSMAGKTDGKCSERVVDYLLSN